MDQIFREMFSFALAHLDQLGQRRVQRALDRGPGLVRVDVFFRRPHHAWRLQNRADGDLARRAQFFLQRAHRFVIGAGQGGIEREVARSVRAFVQCDHDIGAAARNFLVDRLPDARFQLSEVARQIHDDVALFAIHRVQFDAEFRAVVIDFAAAVASHASHCVLSTLGAQKNARKAFMRRRGDDSRRGDAAKEWESNPTSRSETIVATITRSAALSRERRAA